MEEALGLEDSISRSASRLFLTRLEPETGGGVAWAGPHPALLWLARRGGGSRGGGGGSGGGEGPGGGLAAAAANGLAGIGAVRRLLPARRGPGHGRNPQG